MSNNLLIYEEVIHNKLQSIRYKFNYLLSIINNNDINNNNNDNDINNNDNDNVVIDNIELDILNLELDNIEYILNNFISDSGGNYQKDIYKELEAKYLDHMNTNIHKLYLDKQSHNKESSNTIINSTFPILFQIMMMTDKESIYNSLTFNKKEEL